MLRHLPHFFFFIVFLLVVAAMLVFDLRTVFFPVEPGTGRAVIGEKRLLLPASYLYSAMHRPDEDHFFDYDLDGESEIVTFKLSSQKRYETSMTASQIPHITLENFDWLTAQSEVIDVTLRGTNGPITLNQFTQIGLGPTPATAQMQAIRVERKYWPLKVKFQFAPISRAVDAGQKINLFIWPDATGTGFNLEIKDVELMGGSATD